MLRSVAIVATAFLVSGCATAYSPLYSPAEVAQTAKARAKSVSLIRGQDDAISTSGAVTTCEQKPITREDRLSQTLACAEVLQYVYSNGYRDISAWRDIATLPVIGGAGAGALILLNQKDEAVKRAGKVALGIGVISAVRDQFWPSSVPLAFIKGHAALGCVIAEGEYFVGDPALEVHRNLESNLGTLSDKTVYLSLLRSKSPSPPATEAEAAQLKSAHAVAEQALVLANDQIEAGSSQAAAYDFASSPFRKAVTEIGAWVATKGRDRPNFSYDEFVGKYAPADSGGQARTLDEATLSRRTYTAQQLLSELAEKTQEVVVATRRLRASTPDYKARLVEVGKCASSLTS
jgi:hypothetical protein